MQSSSLLDKSNQVGHVQALNLRAVALLDGVILHVLLLAGHDPVHKEPIRINLRHSYPLHCS